MTYRTGQKVTVDADQSDTWDGTIVTDTGGPKVSVRHLPVMGNPGEVEWVVRDRVTDRDDR